MNTSLEPTPGEPTQALLRGVQAALTRPVLLDPRSVDAVLAATAFHLQSNDSIPAGAEPFSRIGNVAVVDIRGPIAQREWDCMGIFGGDGYDAIAQRMLAAIADTQTSGVLMRIDSPGGEVPGCFEAVREIRAAAQASGKSVVAYADELMASAAYALACVASVIVLPDTGVLGSIGVITTVLDESALLEKSGAKIHVIASGARKSDGHPAIPLNNEARAAIQAEINHIAQVFAGEVARSRGMSEEAVLSLEAGVFLGQSAVDKGLADYVGNLRDALAIAAVATQKKPRAVSARPIDGEKTMKSLMIELGLTENASETEALKAVKATAARAERAEKAVAKFLASTGQADADAAAGVVDAWKVDATRAKALDAENKEMKAKQVEADVDAMLAEGRRAMRVMPAELPALRAKGLEDPGWLKGYLAVKTSTAQAHEFREPGREGEKVKGWKDMTPQQKADLYLSDRATYEALKAAAKAA